MTYIMEETAFAIFPDRLMALFTRSSHAQCIDSGYRNKKILLPKQAQDTEERRQWLIGKNEMLSSLCKRRRRMSGTIALIR